MTKSRRPDSKSPSRESQYEKVFARVVSGSGRCSSANFWRNGAALPIFESGHVHPEALAAILLFQQAAEAEQVTRALLDQVAARLQRTTAG